jgi:hypothetical protein
MMRSAEFPLLGMNTFCMASYLSGKTFVALSKRNFLLIVFFFDNFEKL